MCLGWKKPALTLSSSERRTLRYVGEGTFHKTVLDWLAVQRLRRMGLVEERDRETMLTKEGQLALAQIGGLRVG